MFDTKMSARIEGGSASLDASKSRREQQRGIYREEERLCRIKESTTGVDNTANIEGGCSRPADLGSQPTLSAILALSWPPQFLFCESVNDAAKGSPG